MSAFLVQSTLVRLYVLDFSTDPPPVLFSATVLQYYTLNALFMTFIKETNPFETEHKVNKILSSFRAKYLFFVSK